MAVPAKSGLSYFLLFLIIITTISYLVLNLVSFSGRSWISHLNLQLNFGLWTFCDRSVIPNVCVQWSDKPDFIRSAQALEIISLIFYIISAFLILIGIINPGGEFYSKGFLVAAVLLFVSIIFISASLGLMANKGRDNNTSFAILDWSWWTGLFGLLMTIICFASLIGIVLAIQYSSASQIPPQHSQSNHFHPNPISSSYPNGVNYNINSNSYPQTSNPMVSYGSNYNENNNPDVSHLAQEFVWESNPNNQYAQPYGESFIPPQYYDTYL